MIVRSINSIIGTEHEVKAENGNWTSRRLILKKDGMGFSFHETIIHAGTETYIWYKNHLESVYCIEGEGEIETLADACVYPLKPGTLYALDKHDEHLLRCSKEMRLMCVFLPALLGKEVHQEDGSYALCE